MSRSTKRFLSLRISCWNVGCNVYYLLHPYDPSLFDHPNDIWRGVNIVTLYNSLQSPFASFLLDTNIPTRYNCCEVICRQCNWINSCSLLFILSSCLSYWIKTWVKPAQGSTLLWRCDHRISLPVSAAGGWIRTDALAWALNQIVIDLLWRELK